MKQQVQDQPDKARTCLWKRKRIIYNRESASRRDKEARSENMSSVWCHKPLLWLVWFNVWSVSWVENSTVWQGLGKQNLFGPEVRDFFRHHMILSQLWTAQTSKCLILWDSSQPWRGLTGLLGHTVNDRKSANRMGKKKPGQLCAWSRRKTGCFRARWAGQTKDRMFSCDPLDPGWVRSTRGTD